MVASGAVADRRRSSVATHRPPRTRHTDRSPARGYLHHVAVDIPGLPGLAWTNGEGDARHDPDAHRLVLTAAAGVDWTNDPLGGPAQQRATLLGFRAPDTDFTLSARVSVAGTRTTFDAAVLAVWIDSDHWAKLCFECSPQGEAMVVSVVTNGWSDDCNSTVVAAGHVHLRILRAGPALAFHWSPDGQRWHFVRVFRLSATAPAVVGFMAQAPTGLACTAAFEQIRLTHDRPADLRDGS